MPGTKRAAADDGTTTTSPKAAKKAKPDSPAAKKAGAAKGKKGAAATKAKAIPTSDFQTMALPLHVNLTHTPPSMPASDADAESTVAVAPLDPGHLGSLTLIPSSFKTGSYGWKGNKRLTIELENSGEGGKKEKVSVMLTINATVLGSKGADKEDAEDAEADAVEQEAEEAAEEE